MVPVIRRLVAAALVIAVQVGAICAPLVHAHPADRASDHHDGREVHAHLTPHGPAVLPPNGAAIDHEDDDRAVFLQSFVAVAITALDTPAAPCAGFALVSPAESAPHESLHVAHGHDPPYSRSRPSRAPPAFLS